MQTEHTHLDEASYSFTRYYRYVFGVEKTLLAAEAKQHPVGVILCDLCAGVLADVVGLSCGSARE